jgi:heat shock protein HslJ
MKNIFIGVSAVLILIVVIWAFNSYVPSGNQTNADYKNAEYAIEGERIKLENGVAETEGELGSVAKVMTRYFGNVANGDLNADGIPDVAFILTQDTGGSGTFYYVVGAIQNKDGEYSGTSGVFLGDRIAPQTTEIQNGIVIVNYADRAADESFTTSPSIGKSIWLKLNPTTMQFGEVAQNFEGEADPSRMTLGMKKWTWVSALYNDGREIKPNKPGVFTVTFRSNKEFTATTDCNSMGGEYVALNGQLSFSKIISTEMYCGGSQESEFASLLQNTSGYHFTSRGELILDLKFDSGSVVFK